MPVKQLAVEQIVNGQYILRAIENWEGMRFMPSLRRVGVVVRGINMDGKQLPSLLRPPLVQPLETIQVFLGTRDGCGPEIEKHSFTATGGKSFVVRGRIVERKIRSGYGNQKPGLDLLRNRFRRR